jgi:uncharacterized protein DUF3237
MTRRTFARLSAAAASVAAAPAILAGAGGDATSDEPRPAAAPDAGKLQSEFLLDLVFEKGQASSVGSVGVDRVVVPVLGGTFEGPRLKGTVIGPSGDWIVARPDGSSLLELRLLLQTDDAQKILMTCRGIAHAEPGGGLYARILPMFETGAAKYAWMNSIAAVGVYRPMPGKVAYTVHQIL